MLSSNFFLFEMFSKSLFILSQCFASLMSEIQYNRQKTKV